MTLENNAIQKEAISIAEFCAQFQFSKAHFYNMKAQGKAPKTVKFGNRVLILSEAIAGWKVNLLGNTETKGGNNV